MVPRYPNRRRTDARRSVTFAVCLLLPLASLQPSLGHVVPRDDATSTPTPPAGRERISLNAGWRFRRWETNPDGLTYDLRPDQTEANLTLAVLKPWVLPSANDFIADPADHHQPPAADPPGGDVPYLQRDFDDSGWDAVALPHDWAIAGPFYADRDDPVVAGSMGRLPVHGVGWYRRRVSWTRAEADAGRRAYLDVDGAMSYAVVWVNGRLAGGWPYPYNSFRLDVTALLVAGDDNGDGDGDEDNVVAIRLDNPNRSARWYPGGGLYRNVWLTKTDPVHVGEYGTFVTTEWDEAADEATVALSVRVVNEGEGERTVEVQTTFEALDLETGRPVATGGEGQEEVVVVVVETVRSTVRLAPAGSQTLNDTVVVRHPRLWVPGPAAEPNLYLATTRVYDADAAADADDDDDDGAALVDSYETRFGIRSVRYDADEGLVVNGRRVEIQGVNEHHDLGALGAAFHARAAERKLARLRDMGVNAVRMAHNPPAPELLDLTDRMGLLVLDEIFDCWRMPKTDNDFHLVFDDWHEADLRRMARRDRNHPSVVLWSYGNEVGEQAAGEAGAALSAALRDVLAHEDPTRPSSASQNQATPDQPWSRAVDVFYLNYQGAGIRDTVAYSNLAGIRTPPLYAAYHGNFSDRMVLSSESASALSSRGAFTFPVTPYDSAPVNDSSGGDPRAAVVSGYELYTAGFGSSPDKVFASQDASPFAAGEFVWTGSDYLGEPTPYDAARSAYSGALDLAGLPKERFHLYRARWRPDVRAARIVPHWTWPGREGLATPVHVFAAADRAELFLDGRSLGARARGPGEYRFRWDDVVYRPGELTVVTHRGGEPWASASVRTAGAPARVRLEVERVGDGVVRADGVDLAFVTAAVVDARGDVVPGAGDALAFAVEEGPGEVVATDNGDPVDFTPFPSPRRNAYYGLAVAIVRGRAGEPGAITVTASAEGLEEGRAVVVTT